MTLCPSSDAQMQEAYKFKLIRGGRALTNPIGELDEHSRRDPN